MTEAVKTRIREEARFSGIQRLEQKPEQKFYVAPDREKNDTDGVPADQPADMAGAQTGRLEQAVAAYIGSGSAVAVSSVRTALWFAVRLAAERMEESGLEDTGNETVGKNLSGRRVFCPDFASEATAAVILGCGGIPVFIDASPEDWGMDPEALAAAFEQYPDVKLVLYTHVYGFPGRIDKIKKLCESHGALLIEDASDVLGANYQKRPCGSFGDYAIIDIGNAGMSVGDIGDVGGVLLLHGSGGSQNERSDVTGSDVRKLQEYLNERIRIKKKIYENYADRLADLDIWMNPYDGQAAEPNYQMSCMMISENGLSRARQEEAPGSGRYVYEDVHGRTCPPELRDALEAFGAEGRLVWRPLHFLPLYRGFEFVTAEEEMWNGGEEEGNYIYERSLCLPSDVGMTEKEQERVIEIIYACFNNRERRRTV